MRSRRRRRREKRFLETMNECRVGLRALPRGGAPQALGGVRRRRGGISCRRAAMGGTPSPGLAQLRLAQGRSDAALSTIRRVLGEATDPLKRAGLLPAYVEMMLAVGDVEEARSACSELEEIAARYESVDARSDRRLRARRGPCWPTETPGRPCCAAGGIGRVAGAGSAVRRSRALACSSGSPVAISATRRRQRSSWKLHVRRSSDWARRRTSRASTRSVGRHPVGTTHGLTAA